MRKMFSIVTAILMLFASGALTSAAQAAPTNDNPSDQNQASYWENLYGPGVMMALSEFPQSCSSEFLGSRGKVSAGWCRW